MTTDRIRIERDSARTLARLARKSAMHATRYHWAVALAYRLEAEHHESRAAEMTAALTDLEARRAVALAIVGA